MKLKIPKLMVKKNKIADFSIKLVEDIDGTIINNNDNSYIEVIAGLSDIEKSIRILKSFKK